YGLFLLVFASVAGPGRARYEYRAGSLAQHAIRIRAEQRAHGEARAVNAQTDQVNLVFPGVSQNLVGSLSGLDGLCHPAPETRFVRDGLFEHPRGALEITLNRR